MFNAFCEMRCRTELLKVRATAYPLPRRHHSIVDRLHKQLVFEKTICCLITTYHYLGRNIGLRLALWDTESSFCSLE